MRYIATLSFVLVLCGNAAPAWAMTFSGINCRPATNIDAAKVVYGRAFGIHNVSSSSAQVFCPITTDGPLPDEDTTLTMNVYDRNSTSDVACLLQVLNINGDVIRSYGVGSAGGQPGAGSQAPAVEFREPGVRDLVLDCILPPAESGWVSHITSYLIPDDGLPEINVRHGSTCVAVDNANRGRVSYTNSGVYNSSSTSAAKVVCDLTDRSLREGLQSPGLFVYDRNSQKNVSCTFRFSDLVGVERWGQPELSAISTGNFSTLQRVGVQATVQFVQLITAECTIPPLSSSGNLSSIFFSGR
jgi:hypothetical protein